MFTRTTTPHNHAPYLFSLTKKKKPVYHCGDDYIEVPGGSDTVPYEDEDGNQYEIPLDDLIEYDGDDGEIQYTSGKKKSTKVRCPSYNQKVIMQAMIAQQLKTRVYS